MKEKKKTRQQRKKQRNLDLKAYHGDDYDPRGHKAGSEAFDASLLAFLLEFCAYVETEHPFDTVRTDALRGDAETFMRKINEPEAEVTPEEN